MTITKTQTTGGHAVSPLVMPFVTAAGSLIVLICNTTGTTAPTITDSAGQTYTAIGTTFGAVGRNGGMYYVPNSAALTSVTVTQDTKIISATLLEIGGIVATSPLDKSGTHAVGYTNYTLTAGAANTNADEFVVAGVLHTFGSSSTTDVIYTGETAQKDFTTANGVCVRAYDKVVNAIETSSIALTVSGYGDFSIIAAFKAAAVAAGKPRAYAVIVT